MDVMLFVCLNPTIHDNIIKYSGHPIKTYSAWSKAANNGKTSFVDARDISAVIVESVLHPEKHSGKIYVLTGPEALSDTDQAEILSKELGKTITYKSLPAEEWEKQLVSFGTPAAVAKDLVVLDGFRAAGYCGQVSPAVKEVTGKDPISFAQWAKDNAHALK